MNVKDDDILEAIYRVIQARKESPGENSYTSSLLRKGIDKIPRSFFRVIVVVTKK